LKPIKEESPEGKYTELSEDGLDTAERAKREKKMRFHRANM